MHASNRTQQQRTPAMRIDDQAHPESLEGKSDQCPRVFSVSAVDISATSHSGLCFMKALVRSHSCIGGGMALSFWRKIVSQSGKTGQGVGHTNRGSTE